MTMGGGEGGGGGGGAPNLEHIYIYIYVIIHVYILLVCYIPSLSPITHVVAYYCWWNISLKFAQWLRFLRYFCDGHFLAMMRPDGIPPPGCDMAKPFAPLGSGCFSVCHCGRKKIGSSLERRGATVTTVELGSLMNKLTGRKRHPTSTNINQHQPTSTNITQHQATN